MLSKRVAIVKDNCVSCGNCVKYCPINAIAIHKGLYASIDQEKCVGCGRCETACPAGVIQIQERGVL